MNQQACDTLGSGGYVAPGMEGLDPANGNLYVNPANTADYYLRARGLGADDMLLTTAGLCGRYASRSATNSGGSPCVSCR